MPRRQMSVPATDDAAIKAVTVTPTRNCFFHEKHVILPYLFQKGKKIVMTRRQTLFVHSYSPDRGIDEACLASGLSKASALRLLKRPDVQEYVADLLEEDQVFQRWKRPAHWAAEGEKMFREEEVPQHRIAIWKEFGEVAIPKEKTSISLNQTNIYNMPALSPEEEKKLKQFADSIAIEAEAA